MLLEEALWITTASKLSEAEQGSVQTLNVGTIFPHNSSYLFAMSFIQETLLLLWT